MSSGTLTQRTPAAPRRTPPSGAPGATVSGTTKPGTTKAGTTKPGTTKAGARARATSRRPAAPGTRKPAARGQASAPAAGGTAPFVLLIMVLLTSGLVATLWLSTAAAADSYRLEDARQATRDRSEEVERLHRDVAAMQAAPALAASAERIGMVPAGTPAVILVHPDGTSQVVGTPAEARAATPPAPPAAPPAAPAATPGTRPDAEALGADPATGVQASSGGTPAPAPTGAGTTTRAARTPTANTADTAATPSGAR